jgi:hypothetical protein
MLDLAEGFVVRKSQLKLLVQKVIRRSAKIFPDDLFLFPLTPLATHLKKSTVKS